VWCQSKKGADKIRSFELSGKEIFFSNHDETESKEKKNKKNESNKSTNRRQRVQSWKKQGNIKMLVSEDHAS